jgi:hypothetical protein
MIGMSALGFPLGNFRSFSNRCGRAARKFGILDRGLIINGDS